MRYLYVLIVITAMICVAAGSAKGISGPGPLRFASAAMVASGPSSSPAVNGEESVSKAIFPAALNSTIGQLLVLATAEDGEKNPPPRSTHCPPDKDDHPDANQKSSNDQNKDNQDKDNKEKEPHGNCGKGDDGKNP